MADENPKKRIIGEINKLEYDYKFDQKEFGKIMIIASFSLLVVSLHALYTINVAVDQASNSTTKIENTEILVNSDDFRESMSSLAATGVTIQDQSIDEVLTDLEYATESLSEVKKLSNTLEGAQKTYQWTILVSILGLTTGLTSIYI